MRPRRLHLSALFLASTLTGCGGGPETSSSGAGGATSSAAGGATSSAGSAGAGGATSSGSSGGQAGSGGVAGGGAGPVTLLTLNLHCFQLGGTTFASNADRFAAIIDFAAAQGVDVLTVQEACERPGESAMDTLREGLSNATGQSWSGEWAFAHVAWQGTPDEADEGVGLLVRGQSTEPSTLDHAVQGALRRVAVSARIPAGPRVMSVHLDVFDAAVRAAQAREAAAVALAGSDPDLAAVVAGDFNDVEGSPPWSALPAMGYLPADEGLDANGIDHVMIHRAAPLRPVKVEKVLTGMQAVSDHPGVLVRLEPAPADAVTVTRIVTQADPGAGHFLSVRGDAAPLSWNVGYPMALLPPAGRVLLLTEPQGVFQLKLLRDDADWQLGPNVSATAGKDIAVDPAF